MIGTPGVQSTDEVQSVPWLTLRLRSRPYTVLLLDEIEKAHMSVRLLFLHAIDTGRMVDNLGNEIYLRNTVVIMTTNLGFSSPPPLIALPGQATQDAVRASQAAALAAIKDAFPKEFLGRMDDIILFKPLTRDIMRGFVMQKIQKIADISGKLIDVSDSAIDLICERGFHPEYGARDLNRAVDDLLGYRLAKLKFSVDWDNLKTIAVGLSPDGPELTVNTE